MSKSASNKHAPQTRRSGRTLRANSRYCTNDEKNISLVSSKAETFTAIGSLEVQKNIMSKTRKQSRAVQAKTIVHAENRSVEQKNLSCPLIKKIAPDVAKGIEIRSVIATPPTNTEPKDLHVKNAKIENKSKKYKKHIFTRYSIDCSLVDKIIDLTDLRKFLQTIIARKLNIGESDGRISVVETNGCVTLKANIQFKKASLKYFVKKYLKKQRLRRSVKAMAHPDSKKSYVLKPIKETNT